MKARGLPLVAVLLGASLGLVALPAQADEQLALVPPAAREADLEEHLGARVRADLPFLDHRGRHVVLGQYLGGDAPVVVVLAYYRCPMLCGLVLHGLVDGLKELGWAPGERYRLVTASFNPRDTPPAAQQKRLSTLAGLGAPDTDATWPFLVGSEASSRALADDLGFRYAYDPNSDQYAHPAAAIVLTPDGRISRYLYGTRFSAKDLRLALLEASDGKIGTIVDRVLMTCYRFDPATRRYGPAILGFLRLGGVFVVASVGTLLAALWLRERRNRDEGGPVS